MNSGQIQISIASGLGQVWLVRTAVRAIAAEFGFDETSSIHIELAVAEAVNNIIEHAYNCRETGRVDLLIRAEEGALWLDLADDGKPFPAERMSDCFQKPEDREFGEREGEPRGRGLLILREVMDSIRFERSGGRNHLLLRKDRPAASV